MKRTQRTINGFLLLSSFLLTLGFAALAAASSTRTDGRAFATITNSTLTGNSAPRRDFPFDFDYGYGGGGGVFNGNGPVAELAFLPASRRWILSTAP